MVLLVESTRRIIFPTLRKEREEWGTQGGVTSSAAYLGHSPKAWLWKHTTRSDENPHPIVQQRDDKGGATSRFSEKRERDAEKIPKLRLRVRGLLGAAQGTLEAAHRPQHDSPQHQRKHAQAGKS